MELGNLSEMVLDAIYPKRCPVCGEAVDPAGRDICEACEKILVPVRGNICSKCGRPVRDVNSRLCDNCKRIPHEYDMARVLYPYNQILKRSLSAFKYHGRREYAAFFARSIYEHFEVFINMIGPDVIIPVPVYKDRLRVRGYNQAELVADRLSELTGIPAANDFLLRVKHTEAQKLLGPDARRKNLAGAFAVNKDSDWYRQYINSALIIDDIYTTGSTGDVCAEVLKAVGVGKVYFICIAGVEADC